MFLTTNTCEGKRDCIKQCPTKAIRFINGRAFSCLTCGICYENCPNHAIFKNSYGGYVVDRAKCNGCGMCMYNCPTSNITIEDGIVYGICSRCGVCAEECPDCRIDGFELEKDKQITLIKSLNILNPPLDNVPHKSENIVTEVSRSYFGTDIEKCILCGRCEEYCPTGAIHVKVDRDEGICRECRLCADVCPNESMNKHQIVNNSSCTLCLNCLKACPHNAISVDDFKIVINKLNQKPNGKIIYCLNCGLCADLCENESLKRDDGKLRYNPTEDTENVTHDNAIGSCPIQILREDDEMFIYDEFDDEELPALSGFCVSCGKCVQVCDDAQARQYMTHTWDGKSVMIVFHVEFVWKFARKMQSHCIEEKFQLHWINVFYVKIVQFIVQLMQFLNQQCIKMKLKMDLTSLSKNYVCIVVSVMEFVHMMQLMRLTAIM